MTLDDANAIAVLVRQRDDILDWLRTLEEEESNHQAVLAWLQLGTASTAEPDKRQDFDTPLILPIGLARLGLKEMLEDVENDLRKLGVDVPSGLAEAFRAAVKNLEG